MTDLRRLKTSLTKHGAHKVAQILATYPYADALKHINSTKLGIRIEEVQTRHTLGATRNGPVPALWGKVQALGRDAIDGMVMLAIISSHHELLAATSGSANAGVPYQGRVERGVYIESKSYTNFVDDIRELGFGVASSDAIDFDFSPIFGNPKLGPLARQLFELRLNEARWSRGNTVEDELIQLGFHKAFNVPEKTFRAWLAASAPSTSAPVATATAGGTSIGVPPSSPSGAPAAPGLSPGKLPAEDADFIASASDTPSRQAFKFRAGHTPRKTGTVAVTGRQAGTTASLEHNEIQTRLYHALAAIHGAANVGTEVPAGDGTSIDVVVKGSSFLWFYEIKTADTVKGCIRQAIPQLLEYAYWNPKSERPSRLFVVSTLPVTAEGEAYLKFLREEFNVPISYLQAS